ncbi:hypothetical protein ACFQX6_57155 [Streptosporangium lutulentum]
MPGNLTLAPVPEDLRRAIAAQAPQDHWGEIRPPGIPRGDAVPLPDTSRPAAASPAPAAKALDGVTTVAVVEPDFRWRTPHTLVALLGLAALTVVAYRLRRR